MKKWGFYLPQVLIKGEGTGDRPLMSRRICQKNVSLYYSQFLQDHRFHPLPPSFRLLTFQRLVEPVDGGDEVALGKDLACVGHNGITRARTRWAGASRSTDSARSGKLVASNV